MQGLRYFTARFKKHLMYALSVACYFEQLFKNRLSEVKFVYKLRIFCNMALPL